MSNDKEIEDYIEKADKLKIQEKQYAEKAKRQELEEEKESAKEKARDRSFDFYSAMNPNQPGSIWFKVLMAFVLGTEMIWFANVYGGHFGYLYFISFGLGILWGLRYVYSWIYTYVTFAEFKNWQKGLGFEVKGWEQLTHSENEFGVYFWRVKCALKINFKGDFEAQRKAIDAVGYLFTVNANKCLYDLDGGSVAGYAEDPRINWSFSNNTLSGSSNIKVVWEIYRLIKNDLSLLEKKYGIIDSVEINADQQDENIHPRIRQIYW